MMEDVFINDNMYCVEDTVVAIATAIGPSGVAIVRISGNEAWKIALRMCRRESFVSRFAHYVTLYDAQGAPIDRAIALPFQGPASFTGEDVVEFQCHGGVLIPSMVVRAACAAGARMAHPGEFTYRAVQHGKLSLAQAESLHLLITAQHQRALKAAQRIFQGDFEQHVRQLQKQCIHLAAQIEAWIDFPDEELPVASYAMLAEQTHSLIGSLEQWHTLYQGGAVGQEQCTICLVGRPNVGKSSLLNCLVGRQRTIVSDQPGTTRDWVDASMLLDGVPLTVVDTAGVRTSGDTIELEGVERAHRQFHQADLLLFIADATAGWTEDDATLFATLPRDNVWVVWNKTDAVALEKPHAVSAKTGSGIAPLKKALSEWYQSQYPLYDTVPPLVIERHLTTLIEVIAALKRVVEGLSQQLSPDFLAVDTQCALHHFASLTGDDVSEEVLNHIFSQFCLGK